MQDGNREEEGEPDLKFRPELELWKKFELGLLCLIVYPVEAGSKGRWGWVKNGTSMRNEKQTKLHQKIKGEE